MTLEQDISNLVQAADRLTDVADNQFNTFDQRMSQAEENVEQALDNLSVLGDGGVGSTVVNAASFFTTQTGAGYLHIKLPWNTKHDNKMFHVHVRGYEFGVADIIDATFSGYVNKANNGVVHTSVSGTHKPAIYHSEDGAVYLRITFTDGYFMTAVVDTTRVGNGTVIPRGAIDIIRSTEPTL